MAARIRRKKLRNIISSDSTPYITKPSNLVPYVSSYYNFEDYVTQTAYDNTILVTQNDKTILQQKFYDIIDMIIKQNEFTNIVTSLNSILEFTGPYSDYCRKLETVMENLCGVIANISDTVSVSIIQTRIEYIRSLIKELPEACEDYRPLSDMIMNLISVINSSFDMNEVTNNVNDVHQFVDTNFSLIEINAARLIEDTLINIICNISQGNNTAIIASRIEYVRTKLLPLLKK
jgi:hypothetical protein